MGAAGSDDDLERFEYAPALTGRWLPTTAVRELPFWRSGELVFPRCAACGWFLHPPLPRCPRCHGADLRTTTVAPTGRIHAYTVNHHAWEPDVDGPYVVAIVELDVQPGLRVTTNLVGASRADLVIGRRVRARHVAVGDLHVPVFEPETS